MLNRHRMAWLVIIIGFTISGFTVHFWNSLFAYFFFLIGSGAWLVQPQRRSFARRSPVMRPVHSQQFQLAST
jgi:hypothetical protein